MKAVRLALAVLALVSGGVGPAATLPTGSPSVVPAAGSPARPPMLLGATTAPAILANRASFRANLAKVRLTEGLKARWKAVRRPLTLVAVFGSWCGDSHRQLPGLLALEAEANPFIEVHYLGVSRSKALAPASWPRGCAPQPVERVPTFYLFAQQPGGSQQLAGSVVETPPRAGQTMAEALVELVEASRPR